MLAFVDQLLNERGIVLAVGVKLDDVVITAPLGGEPMRRLSTKATTGLTIAGTFVSAPP